MDAYIIGVDIGTTATKTLVFDQAGQTIATASKGYSMYHETAGMMTQNPDEIFKAVIATLAQVTAKIDVKQIVGISFSAAMHSLLVLDDTNQLLTPLMTWADNRAAKVATRLKERSDAKALYERTGTPIHPMTPLSKILWLKAERPTIYQQAAKYIGIKEYIIFRLVGEFKIDESLASATGLYNLQTGTWDKEALRLTGINSQQLSTIVPIDYQLTGIAAQIASKIGVPDTVPLIIGGSDGALSNLGLDVDQPGVAAITIGTSGAVRVITNQPLIDPAGRLFCYRLSENRYLIGGPVNSGAFILGWLADLLKVPKGQPLSPAELIDLATDIPAGAEGLFFHPYIGGERAPLWDAKATGSFFGLTTQHTQDYLVRAVLEGILFNIEEVLLAVAQLTGPIMKVRAAGGFARSTFWTQMLADILNKEVIIPQNVESSAIGAAVIGMQSLGLTFKLPTEVAANYLPGEDKAAYQQLWPFWQQLRTIYQPLFAVNAVLKEQLKK